MELIREKGAVCLKRRRKGSAAVFLILKYAFAAVFPALVVFLHGMDWRFLLIACAEILAIAILTNLLCGIQCWLGYVFNVLALLILNAQFVVLYWGNTFTSMVMLANLDSIHALSGKFLVYGVSAALVFAFSFLPVRHLSVGKGGTLAGLLVLAAVYGAAAVSGALDYSPYYALYELCRQKIAMDQALEEANALADGENEFYRSEVGDYIEKPAGLPELPNVILVFVEGFSQNIVEDPRDITPNIRTLEEQSIFFDNYFNHTFATYMGLSGQLYSGYQHDTYDVNNLVSIQDVFRSYGYQTTFINTEPRNAEFSNYLDGFDFDDVITDEDRLDGMADTLSDKSAFELLLETALEQNEEGTPFFLSTYSFGTHASFDGIYEQYGDGSDPLLNKFYDLDTQVGGFLEKFRESELAENTVFILTADHATYQDADFTAAFPGYERRCPQLDRVPLIICFNGVMPAVYDVNGRNSLDLAPTVLDFLDMSMENCFLGASLFALEGESDFDTYFESFGGYRSTANGEVALLTGEELQEIEQRVIRYFSIKLADSAAYENYTDAVHIYATVREDVPVIELEICNALEWKELLLAIWSEADGQDDLQWYRVPGGPANIRTYSVDLSDFDTDGDYDILVYGIAEEDEPVFLASAQVTVALP